MWNVSKRAPEFVAQKVDTQPHPLSPSGLGPVGPFNPFALLEADDAKEIFKTVCTGYCWVPDGAALVLSGRGDLFAHLPQQPDSNKFHATSPCGHYLHPVYIGPVPTALKALAVFGVQLWTNRSSIDGVINGTQLGRSLSSTNGKDGSADQGSSASAAGSEDTQSRQSTDSESQGSNIDESSNDQSGKQQSSSCDGSGEDSDSESGSGSSSSDLESLSSDSDSDSDDNALGGAGGISAGAQNASANSTAHGASTAPETQDQPGSPAPPAASTTSPHRRRQLLHRLPQANVGPFFPPRGPAGKKVLTRSSPLVAHPPVTPDGHTEPSSFQQDNEWRGGIDRDKEPDFMSHVLMSRRRRHARKVKPAAAATPLSIKTDTTDDAPLASASAPAFQPRGSGLANRQMVETSLEGLLELQRAKRIARSDSTLPPTLAPDFDEILAMYADMKKTDSTKPAVAAGSSAQSIFAPRNRVTDRSYSAVVTSASTAPQAAVTTANASTNGATAVITQSAVVPAHSASNGVPAATASTSTNGTGSSAHADGAASGSSASGSFTATHVPRCECDLSRILDLPVADECSCWDIIVNDTSDSKAE